MALARALARASARAPAQSKAQALARESWPAPLGFFRQSAPEKFHVAQGECPARGSDAAPDAPARQRAALDVCSERFGGYLKGAGELGHRREIAPAAKQRDHSRRQIRRRRRLLRWFAGGGRHVMRPVSSWWRVRR